MMRIFKRAIFNADQRWDRPARIDGLFRDFRHKGTRNEPWPQV